MAVTCRAAVSGSAVQSNSSSVSTTTTSCGGASEGHSMYRLFSNMRPFCPLWLSAYRGKAEILCNIQPDGVLLLVRILGLAQDPGLAKLNAGSDVFGQLPAYPEYQLVPLLTDRTGLDIGIPLPAIRHVQAVQVGKFYAKVGRRTVIVGLQPRELRLQTLAAQKHAEIAGGT